MKMYKIAKGTKSILIDEKSPDRVGQPGSRKWKTRKELSFFDTVTDPIRISNSLDSQLSCLQIYANLAKVGYAIFRDADNPRYTLAVLYTDVEVL